MNTIIVLLLVAMLIAPVARELVYCNGLPVWYYPQFRSYSGIYARFVPYYIERGLC
jgi:hypothetical protein